MLNDSPERYGSVSKAFHWVIAVLTGWQLLKFFDRIDDGEHWVGETLVSWHVSIGTLLLVLIVLSLLWAIGQRRHRPAQDPRTVKLVKAGHGLLYLGMLLMPITGIFVMLGGGHGLTAFGFELLAEGDEVAWAKAVGSLHSPLAWILTALIAGHIAIAFYHHFIRRDDVLKRML
ncbi:MAG: cytochrome b [Guyparkeria sp.]|uniref:cytochrome b n=1 Tax=Guyparkeria sp. TaxID=2035736 RepID=UPI0039798CB6